MTKISWTDESWNPVVGCTKIAAGCKNCYAERMAHRLASMGKEGYCHVTTRDGKWNGNIYHVFNNVLDKPLHWRKPRKIFVCSMSDLFHVAVPFEFIDKVLGIIALRPQHTFQILTKRPERMSEYFNGLRDDPAQAQRLSFGGCCMDHKHGIAMTYRRKGHLKNLWLGTSISTQADADKNIPILLQIPAAVRFISVEPMLESIVFGKAFLRYIDWVIIGCESGPKRRPCGLEWIENVVRQCTEANVPVFVKQMEIGGKVSKKMEEWPEWAQRQEYPG